MTVTADQPEVYDPRNHDLLAMWSGKEFTPRHAMSPNGHRTVCGVDTRKGAWQTWDYDWHGYVQAAGDACKKCVKATLA